MRARTSATLSAMDGAEKAEEEEVMILPAGYSDDARALWNAATALNRAAAAVSPGAAWLPPLLFFTDPERTPRPWETAARLPAGSGGLSPTRLAADKTKRYISRTKIAVRLMI